MWVTPSFARAARTDSVGNVADQVIASEGAAAEAG